MRRDTGPMSEPIAAVIDTWHEFLRGTRPDALDELLDRPEGGRAAVLLTSRAAPTPADDWVGSLLHRRFGLWRAQSRR